MIPSSVYLLLSKTNVNIFSFLIRSVENANDSEKMIDANEKKETFNSSFKGLRKKWAHITHLIVSSMDPVERDRNWDINDLYSYT